MEPSDQEGLGPWGRLGAPSRESCLPVAGVGDSLLWRELGPEQASQSSQDMSPGAAIMCLQGH